MVLQVWRAWVLLALMLVALSAGAQLPVPQLQAAVTDQTGTLSPEQIASLEQRLREFEAAKGSQVAVLLVGTTQPETIEQYSIRVVEQWQLGRAGVDDGVLLLVAIEDRTVRIEVGYGLEGALPDVLAARIVNQVIVPRFRAGDFAGGIREGVERIIAIIQSEPLPEALQQRPRSTEGFGSVLPMLLMVLFVGRGIARALLGSFGGATALGAVAGVITWVLTSTLVAAIGAGVIAFLFTLLGGGGPGIGGGMGTPRRSGRNAGWGGWSSGHWGGMSGRGGGFGGWSGGGGGFGGGGASGRW